MEYVTTVAYGKGYKTIVRKPILSPEERAKREEDVKKAMIDMKIEMLNNERRKDEQKNRQ